jgi:hypothetical protein
MDTVGGCCWKTITVDFEMAQWDAIRDVWPEVKVCP